MEAFDTLDSNLPARRLRTLEDANGKVWPETHPDARIYFEYLDRIAAIREGEWFPFELRRQAFLALDRLERPRMQRWLYPLSGPSLGNADFYKYRRANIAISAWIAVIFALIAGLVLSQFHVSLPDLFRGGSPASSAEKGEALRQLES